MKKEDINLIARVLTDMKDSLTEIENALKNKDIGKLNEAKSKILRLQIEIDKRI
ncbi:MAG: hypothetical protein N3D20_00245 [Candidatus Pacearchaeota archaeon]|nr:hypothetical protein [Candidatus Pacearchaeota archaeon]